MKKIDKLAKTHREMGKENVSGHMPKDREMSEYCPVRNFETYLEKTSPSVQHMLAMSEECWFQSTKYGSGHKSASSVASARGNIYH